MDGGQQLRSLLIASKPGRALTARFMGVAASVQPKVASWTNEHGPQPVKHGPLGLIGTDIERPLQTQRSDPVLAGGEQPASGEPQGQGRACAVEDRSGGDGATHTARGALEAPVAQTPAVAPQTSRADETGRPAQPLEAVLAVGIGSKPSSSLAE